MGEADPLVLAFRCCLDPETEAAPTPHQKALVLAEISRMGRLMTPLYTGNETDAEVYHREGMRNFALAINSQIQRDPFKVKSRTAIR